MAKKNKKERRASSDAEDSDTPKQKFVRNPRNRDDPSNKIEMDEFHRKIVKSKSHRSTTDKKKIRDIERLLAKEGIPQEIKDKKLADLKLLKKEAKSKKEAEKFDLRYKKIKFVEKRKVIRKIQHATDEAEKKEWQKKLIYIDVSPLFF